MTPKELRALTEEDLVRKEMELREEAFNLKLQFVSGALPGPDSITRTRRDIARVKTILSERQKEKNAG